ncbi:DUF3348 domain-containing protein [Variovorax sp. PAMC 28711]|uniref:DUF3348 domain-containing protein n=1 Tax=Variovorax sp. PAMC 28711 TaxID=1795631 RepID=UPI00078C09F3|nr:DUF3348 domain-containing protein [Variovorax sp. PAMC 28711]AMM24274.1 hypothetical protein AX767_07875 [Variovorax sp. PAMC 28711]
MVQVSRRTGIPGSTLARLLARLTDADAPESKQAFADRLSQWVGWTDAISLSAALNSVSLPAPPSSGPAPSHIEDVQAERVKSAQTAAIAEDMRSASNDAAAAFSAYRRRYLARQQAMVASIGPLRGRLRETLATRSPAMARLAAVDAVMEQVLGAQEHRLLATVPGLLEKHFKRLREAETPDDRAFGKDMHSVLLAELDIRFQPVEALLEALRTGSPDRP